MILPAGIVQGLFPQGQMQTAAEPFTWGSGGRRMLPEDIARQREIGLSRMRADFSPVQHWTQGLGRVAENLLGAVDLREADKAQAANLERSDKVLQALMNPSGSPSASAPPGAASSTMPGGNPAALAQIMSDPYMSPQVQALAKRQLDTIDFENKQRLQAQYGEQPEIVRLAQIAGDMTRSVGERQAAEGRIKALNDPEIVIPGLPGGTYIGPRSGVGMAFGQTPADDAPDTLPPDFFDNEPQGAPSLASAPQAPTTMEPWQYDSFVKSMGKEAADAFLRRQGLRVGGQ